MFTILVKNFGGRKGERFFKSWNNAKEEMNKDVENCCKVLNGKVHTTRDYFNSEKGFSVYEKVASFPSGEECTWYLTNDCFEDE